MNSLRHAVLRRIADSAPGSVDALAAHLEVSPAELASWLEGRARVPDDVFLRAVDILALIRAGARSQRGARPAAAAASPAARRPDPKD
ncbi:MAG TPA: hypothetical protein VFB01_12525 [Burkholderiales bacterium]|nr:hypothetical protein [Burkholderiales bacterium]